MPVRVGLVVPADKKATHSNRLNFLMRGNAGEDDPVQL